MPLDETPPKIVPSTGNYEFNESENKLFDDLAKNVRSVGFWFEVFGAILLINFLFGLIPKQVEDKLDEKRGITTVHMTIPRIDLKDGKVDLDFSTMISGLVYLLIGNWSRRAAWGFQSISKTQGGDIGHLMAALKNLSKLYKLLHLIIFIVVLLVVLILIIITILAMVWMRSAPP